MTKRSNLEGWSPYRPTALVGRPHGGSGTFASPDLAASRGDLAEIEG